MEPLFWIDVFGLSLSIIVMSSLTFLVIGLNPKNKDNLMFACFAGSLVVWTLSALFLRLSLWLEPVIAQQVFLPNKYLWLVVAATSVLLVPILSLLFSVTFLKRRSIFDTLAIILGLLLIAALFIRSQTTAQWTIVNRVYLDTYGLVVHDKSRVATYSLFIFGLYILRSIFLFIRNIHIPESKYLLASLILLFVGFAARGFVYLPFPLMSFSNAICAIILAWVVVTKQMFNPLKQAQDELEASRQKYKSLFEEAPIGYMESDKDGRIIKVNRRELEMLGYTADEMIGKPTWNFILEADTCRKLIQGRLVGTEPPSHDQERTFIRKNGTTFPGLMNDSIIKESKNSIIGIRSTIQDITEHKQAEEEKGLLQTQLARAQKMEAVGQLAGGVAHDLNNVLSGIVGYPEILLMRLPPDSPLVKPIKTIQDAGWRAAAIVQDLLTLSRRNVATMDIVNLNNIINDCLCSPEYSKTMSFHPNITVQNELSSELLYMRGSSVHLQRSIMNLILNAAEAITTVGVIIIQTENMYIDKPVSGYDTIQEGDFIALTVKDTGVGIPEKDIERIFEPFYTNKTMGRSGTGLGMAIVWGTVKDHNGYINVQSVEGEGTTMMLYFPATRDVIPNLTGISPESYQGKGERVLVVDDVLQQCEIAKQMLEFNGYSVLVSSSGGEAISVLQSNPIDIIVLDMILEGGMDGLETYRRISKLRPGQKAIIVSGYAESERVIEAQRLGAGKYVKKPYTAARLCSAVRQELDRK